MARASRMLLPSVPFRAAPSPAGSPPEQGLVLPPPGSSGYLRGLVGHHHALPSRHRVVHVLGQVVAFHADEMAGGGCLACGGNLASGDRDVRDPCPAPAGAAALGAPGPAADGEQHSPSLKSRPSSWLGQRFTTSVTCSAFL